MRVSYAASAAAACFSARRRARAAFASLSSVVGAGANALNMAGSPARAGESDGETNGSAAAGDGSRRCAGRSIAAANVPSACPVAATSAQADLSLIIASPLPVAPMVVGEEPVADEEGVVAVGVGCSDDRDGGEVRPPLLLAARDSGGELLPTTWVKRFDVRAEALEKVGDVLGVVLGGGVLGGVALGEALASGKSDFGLSVSARLELCTPSAETSAAHEEAVREAAAELPTYTEPSLGDMQVAGAPRRVTGDGVLAADFGEEVAEPSRPGPSRGVGCMCASHSSFSIAKVSPSSVRHARRRDGVSKARRALSSSACDASLPVSSCPACLRRRAATRACSPGRGVAGSSWSWGVDAATPMGRHVFLSHLRLGRPLGAATLTIAFSYCER